MSAAANPDANSQQFVERDQFFAQLRKTINEFLEKIPGSRMAFISTIDGHLVYSVQRDDAVAADDFCPFTSSAAGLGSVVADQLHGELREVLVIVDNSMLVTMRMNNDNGNLIFSALVGNQGNLGSVLYQGHACADRLTTILDEMNASE